MTCTFYCIQRYSQCIIMIYSFTRQIGIIARIHIYGVFHIIIHHLCTVKRIVLTTSLEKRSIYQRRTIIRIQRRRNFMCDRIYNRIRRETNSNTLFITRTCRKRTDPSPAHNKTRIHDKTASACELNRHGSHICTIIIERINIYLPSFFCVRIFNFRLCIRCCQCYKFRIKTNRSRISINCSSEQHDIISFFL